MDAAAVHAFIRRNLVSRIGIPRMNPELAWTVAIFWIGRKPTSYANAGGGCGRSSAMSRKISWNICRGMATSAIWEIT